MYRFISGERQWTFQTYYVLFSWRRAYIANEMIEFRNFKKGYTATIYLQTLFLFLEMHEIGEVGNKNRAIRNSNFKFVSFLCNQIIIT